jgi:hypothetical protein
MVVVLFPTEGNEPALELGWLERLAALGITSAAIVRDDSMAGLVLEGWAFDPARAAEAAYAAAGVSDGVRTLRPLVELAVSPAPLKGGAT